jgi:hypothetical protein
LLVIFILLNNNEVVVQILFAHVVISKGSNGLNVFSISNYRLRGEGRSRNVNFYLSIILPFFNKLYWVNNSWFLVLVQTVNCW